MQSLYAAFIRERVEEAHQMKSKGPCNMFIIRELYYLYLLVRPHWE